MTLDAFAFAEILLIVAVIAGSAFVHGIIGFGFPIMAMPILATVFDTKTAVLVTIVPILAIITISSLRGGNLKKSVGRFWFLPVFTSLGGVVGTRLFLVAPTSLLTLLLAIFILTYLLLDRFGPGRFEFVHRHWVFFAAVFSFGAGITETTVNIGVPLVLIYFMLAGVETLAMVQALNFVFLFSKIVQIIGLMISRHAAAVERRGAVAAHHRRGGAAVSRHAHPRPLRRRHLSPRAAHLPVAGRRHAVHALGPGGAAAAGGAARRAARGTPPGHALRTRRGGGAGEPLSAAAGVVAQMILQTSSNSNRGLRGKSLDSSP